MRWPFVHRDRVDALEHDKAQLHVFYQNLLEDARERYDRLYNDHQASVQRNIEIAKTAMAMRREGLVTAPVASPMKPQAPTLPVEVLAAIDMRAPARGDVGHRRYLMDFATRELRLGKKTEAVAAEILAGDSGEGDE